MADHEHEHGHGHGHEHAPGRGRRRHRLGREADRCEVVVDATLVHPHGAGKHPHDHAHDRTQDRRRLTLTLALTGTILVAELIGGFVARSLALLSDAGHMVTDLSAQLLSLLALLFAARPADARRTYGYYRLEILAALANGVVLVVLAGFIMYEAIQRVGSPTEVRTGILIWIASIGLATNLVAAVVLHGARSLNVRGAYLHILFDGLSSLAVVIGALVMHFTDGLYVLDPILGIAIAILVLLGAYRLIREATDVLLEAVPAGIDLEQVRREVQALEGIEDVHDLHIWTITSGMFAMSAHIVVHSGAKVTDNDALLTRVKELLHRNHRITHSTLQIESTDYEHVAHVH